MLIYVLLLSIPLECFAWFYWLCLAQMAILIRIPLQDSQDPNPLIRALAVRTMGCIRVDKITEYLCDPLQRCLKVNEIIFHQSLLS